MLNESRWNLDLYFDDSNFVKTGKHAHQINKAHLKIIQELSQNISINWCYKTNHQESIKLFLTI